ncbi:PREDICTED: mucin-5AC [Chinchilla lanigera]|uniref:mucin-5AC n=1 Tax=Chinchilla lanigera TaxID=34839 RepID=UPI00038EB2E4|nr:PREDICTED: mucin-5AC [Chinchilla lanigera]XP_005375577.1 PREDICTED: mucin-5AC [Chinchilla lanigera]XP_005375578.1 PREDICTED: mucin-5AC [Chinchilla lanigera]XP_005375579.1 PREDICTED: mucin-5AC [Chinchilla lanigera]XP_005375580.1 PREDICTED: mucin-5AC [Chinchilla lanigera]XP_005375581.1 PREDICTED: mucin-5AC [Chinchilla lanigera]XP_005375582.1 PREDICTED: mucin-5AC [Chinchilla lanigera]
MVPFKYYDQHFLPLNHSCHLATTNSLTHQYNSKKLNQLNNQPLAKVQSYSKNFAAPSLNYNQTVQSCSVLPSPKSQLKISQGFNNKATKLQLSPSKCLVTFSPDHWKNSLHPTGKALSSPLSYPKPQTTSLSDLNKTSPSLEPSQTCWSSQLPLPKPQTTSSSPDLHWTSPLLKSNQKVLHSSLSHLQHQETPLLNAMWTSSLRPQQKASRSTLLQSNPQKTSSLDGFWTSLLVHNQRSLSSPSLSSKAQTNNFLQTSHSLEFNQMALISPLEDSRPHKKPILTSNSSVLSLPLSHVKLRKSPLLHSAQQSQSLSVFQPKSQAVLTLDHSFQTLSSPICHSKFPNATSPNDKDRTTEMPLSHLKPNAAGQASSSTKHCLRRTTTSPWGSGLQSKSSLDFRERVKSDREIPWTLHYGHPCIVKGGTIPDRVVNKIITSLSKTRIQRDLSRQILFRRMRGRPNPRPGPRLSSVYTVCLSCASCIKSPCNHLTGKKDPRCGMLFVIPTPEANSKGEIEVKLLFILRLPETSFSPFLPPLSMKGSQLEDTPSDSLEEIEKLSQFFSASESDVLRGLRVKEGWSAASSENQAASPKVQAVDWLLYVKNNGSSDSQSPSPSPPSSSSSSSSSISSATPSPTSSSSSSSLLPSEPLPSQDCSPCPLSNCVVTKLLSYHRLPPGVSWLEFICSKDYQPLPGKPDKEQSPQPTTTPLRNATATKETKGPSMLHKFFSKHSFKNEKP